MLEDPLSFWLIFMLPKGAFVRRSALIEAKYFNRCSGLIDREGISTDASLLLQLISLNTKKPQVEHPRLLNRLTSSEQLDCERVELCWVNAEICDRLSDNSGLNLALFA